VAPAVGSRKRGRRFFQGIDHPGRTCCAAPASTGRSGPPWRLPIRPYRLRCARAAEIGHQITGGLPPPATTDRPGQASSRQRPIPAWHDFHAHHHLLPRGAAKLTAVGPFSLGQAARIPRSQPGGRQCPAALARAQATQGLGYLSQRNSIAEAPQAAMTGTVSHSPAELGLPFLSRSPLAMLPVSRPCCTTTTGRTQRSLGAAAAR